MNRAPRSVTQRIEGHVRTTLQAEDILGWMDLFDEAIERAEHRLTELDCAIGDGDHGVNMRRGSQAVKARLRREEPPELCGRLGLISTTLTSQVGGASGPLYGAFFLQSSRSALHKAELTLNDLVLAFAAGLEGVVKLGKAQPGDKTMVDTLHAAVGSLRGSCGRRGSLPEALHLCAQVARQAARATIPMVARRGRASYLGERSAGTQDPGATSAHFLFESLAQAMASRPHPNSVPTYRTVLL